MWKNNFLIENLNVFATGFLIVTAGFLPINLFVCNLALTLFMIFFGANTLLNFPSDFWTLLNRNKFIVLILSVPLALLLLGMIYSPNTSQGLKILGRMFPIFVVALFVVYKRSFFQKHWKKMFLALTVGSVIAAFICWGFVLIEMYQDGAVISRLFSNEYGSHHLADVINVHTPYLALFVMISIGFCIYNQHGYSTVLPKKGYLFLGVILFLFLLNLMARNALFCFFFFALVYLIKQRKYLMLFLFIVIFGLGSWYAFNTEHNYLRDRFFNSVNVFEKETIFSKKDNRFERLTASYNVFKQFPLIGPGTANEDQFRKEQYYNNRDSEAYNNNYNAHNQFMEYLSTYGALGGISYLILFSFLFYMCYKKRSYFLTFLVASFFIANLTESMLERSWGITYYIILFIAVVSFNPQRIEAHE